MRWWEHGDPEYVAVRKRRDPLVRFWAKVDKNGPIPAAYPELGPCWMWIQSGHHAPDYGFFWDGERQVVASRFSFELENGPLLEGQWVLHHCDNPPCVNPAHLFVGDSALNMADMAAKGRSGRYTRPDRTARGDRSGARTHPEARPRGEGHYAARLTAGQVEEIRRRYAAGGVSQTELGREYGIAQANISRIVLGKACLDRC